MTKPAARLGIGVEPNIMAAMTCRAATGQYRESYKRKFKPTCHRPSRRLDFVMLRGDK
jgi:hypothetical protein